MASDKDVLRHHLEKIPNVTRTWFEWTFDDYQRTLVKTVVVEVDIDTDPNSPAFSQNCLDAVRDTAIAALEAETMMAVDRLRVVPQGVR